MNKIFKGLGLGFLTLALIGGVGVSLANAALTLEALAITSSGALTLDGAVGSAIALGSTQTTGALTLGAAHTSGAITIGGASQTSATTIYGGSATRGVNIIYTNAAITAEAHGLDVTAGGTTSGSGAIIGTNSVVTSGGADADWLSGVYGKTIIAEAGDVTGYASGGEFEVDDNGATVSAAVFPLVLDGNSLHWGGTSAYIMMQDFGAALIPNLLNIQGATSGSGNMFYVHAPTTLAASLKVLIGSTTYYIPLYTTQ